MSIPTEVFKRFGGINKFEKSLLCKQFSSIDWVYIAPYLAPRLRKPEDIINFGVCRSDRNYNLKQYNYIVCPDIPGLAAIKDHEDTESYCCDNPPNQRCCTRNQFISGITLTRSSIRVSPSVIIGSILAILLVVAYMSLFLYSCFTFSLRKKSKTLAFASSNQYSSSIRSNQLNTCTIDSGSAHSLNHPLAVGPPRGQLLSSTNQSLGLSVSKHLSHVNSPLTNNVSIYNPMDPYASQTDQLMHGSLLSPEEAAFNRSQPHGPLYSSFSSTSGLNAHESERSPTTAVGGRDSAICKTDSKKNLSRNRSKRNKTTSVEKPALNPSSTLLSDILNSNEEEMNNSYDDYYRKLAAERKTYRRVDATRELPGLVQNHYRKG